MEDMIEKSSNSRTKVSVSENNEPKITVKPNMQSAANTIKTVATWCFTPKLSTK
jgi:hypothetical protein